MYILTPPVRSVQVLDILSDSPSRLTLENLSSAVPSDTLWRRQDDNSGKSTNLVTVGLIGLLEKILFSWLLCTIRVDVLMEVSLQI